MKRVVITGLGAITPLGNDLLTTWSNMKNGLSGAARITKFDPVAFRTQMACELKGYDATNYLDKADVKRSDLFTQYALIATDMALADSGLELSKMDPYQIGVIWGTGQGGLTTFEEQVTEYVEGGKQPRFSPFFVPKMIANMGSGMISLRHGAKGINFTTTSACATSNTALMDALNYIRWGKAKVIISGGSEAPITSACVGGFSAMKAMSTRNEDPSTASRPFCAHRDGFVLGEGGVGIILEEYEHAKARGAHIYAEVVGASMTADAYHMTATHPEGIGAAKAIELALADAQLNADQVDYINTHATSTSVGDLSEIAAIRSVFGDTPDHLSISATKSMTGHLLGAAGAIEAMVCVMSIQDKVIPPTINTETLDPEIPPSLDIVLGASKEKSVNVAMSNTFGFGGHNGIVVFKKV
jgi:3-oxoacyl-[acyl-carrier-protein] synthase II